MDKVMLISNSDAHSTRKLGREANVFELEGLSYHSLVDVLRKKDRERLPYTIEFFPEEGKYHTDGHRACDFVCAPEETERLKGICPECGKELTRGVLGRVHALADRQTGYRSEELGDFRYIVPLEELIAEATGKTTAAKSVFATYQRMVEEVGPEFHILLEADPEEITAAGGGRVTEAIRRMRQGDVIVKPGYDGVFGRVKIFEEKPDLQGRLDL